jgi:hypothetical protein
VGTPRNAPLAWISRCGIIAHQIIINCTSQNPVRPEPSTDSVEILSSFHDFVTLTDGFYTASIIYPTFVPKKGSTWHPRTHPFTI